MGERTAMSFEMVLTGAGIASGARRITNEELASQVNSSDEWIFKRTGIRTRYFVEPGQSGVDMARKASQEALQDAGLQKEDLDAIIFATLTPDFAFPGNGVLLQEALGLSTIPALDVRNQCSGFLYGLSVASAWIRAGMYRRILLVGSEIHSTGLRLDEEGRDVAVLFGDGAGAVVLEARESESQRSALSWRILTTALGADGSGADLLICRRPGSQFHPRVSIQDLEAGRHYPTMEGRQVFRRAVEVLSREVEAILETECVDRERVILVPHQSNRRINEMVAQRVGLAEHQVIHTIERYGNTTAASIPMALYHCREERELSPGDILVLAAFGSGLTWGTSLIEI